jgi:hypothetical protein
MSKHTQGMVKLETDEKSGYINIYGKRNDGNVRQSDGFGLLITVDCTDTLDDAPFPPMLDEQKANAELIAEAFNVAHETGMGPREREDWFQAIKRESQDRREKIETLEVQRDDLLAALVKIRNAPIGIYGIPEPFLIEVDDAIEKATK